MARELLLELNQGLALHLNLPFLLHWELMGVEVNVSSFAILWPGMIWEDWAVLLLLLLLLEKLMNIREKKRCRAHSDQGH